MSRAWLKRARWFSQANAAVSSTSKPASFSGKPRIVVTPCSSLACGGPPRTRRRRTPTVDLLRGQEPLLWGIALASDSDLQRGISLEVAVPVGPLAPPRGHDRLP